MGELPFSVCKDKFTWEYLGRDDDGFPSEHEFVSNGSLEKSGLVLVLFHYCAELV